MSRRYLRGALVLGVMTLGVAPAAAAPPVEAKPAAEASAPTGTSELDQVKVELERGLESLRLEDAPAPYAAALRSVRAQTLTLDGSYGGVVVDILERQAFGTISVRVGSRERDNTNFFGGDQSPGFVLPLEPSGAATRHKLWLAMDAAYRGATSGYSGKEAALAKLTDETRPPDLSVPPKPVVSVRWNTDPTSTADAKVSDAGFDRDALRELAAQLSAKFAEHPTIDNGDVIIQMMRTDEGFVSTEGVVLGETRDRAYLAVIADTRADDGMHLDHGRVIHLEGLPKAADIRKDGEALVDQVLRELEELAAAPMLDEDYDGPILFETEAAAQLLATTIAVHAGGEPAPLSEFGRVNELEPHWQDRLGRSVMPDWLSVIDDPGQDGFGKYTLDAEGVPAQRLELVDHGELSTLLMTRVPNASIQESNGHARVTANLLVGPSVSNLKLVNHKRGLSKKGLEAEVLRRAREDGYEFAYVIETLRDGNVLGPVPRDSADLYGSGRKVTMPIPARVYRLEPGGKRTLVRGGLLSPASMRVLRRIRAAGRDATTTKMRLAPTVSGGFTAEVSTDGLLVQTVDTQFTTPSLVIDGFELVVERGEHERLPILEHPLRKTAPAAP